MIMFAYLVSLPKEPFFLLIINFIYFPLLSSISNNFSATLNLLLIKIFECIFYLKYYIFSSPEIHLGLFYILFLSPYCSFYITFLNIWTTLIIVFFTSFSTNSVIWVISGSSSYGPYFSVYLHAQQLLIRLQALQILSVGILLYSIKHCLAFFGDAINFNRIIL